MDYYLVAMERTRLSDLFPMKKGGPRGSRPLGLFVGLLGKYSCTGCLGCDIGAVAVGSVRSAGSTARPCRLGWCVAVLVIAVDDGCYTCCWARCYSEIIVQVSVPAARYARFADSAVVDYWCCGRLGELTTWGCCLEVLGEEDVPCGA